MPADALHAASSELDPVAWTTVFDRAWNSSDPAAVEALFLPDASIRFMPPPPPPDRAIYSGSAEIRELILHYIAEKARIQSLQASLLGDTLSWSVIASIGHFRRMGVEPIRWSIEALLRESRISSLTLHFSLETIAALESALSRATVKRLYEAWNARDFATADRMLAAKLLDHAPPVFLDLLPDQSNFYETRSALLSAFPDAEFIIEDLIAEANKVVVRFTLRGTHQAALYDLLPTGRRVEIPGLDIWRLSDETIVEHWGQLDGPGLLKQLGIDPGGNPI